MGGISKFFDFIRRAHYNHSEFLERILDKIGLDIIAKSTLTFARFIYILSFLYIAYSFINFSFHIIKTLIDFYHFAIDFLNDDLNNTNGLYYNPFLLVFKNVFLPPLMFVLDIVLPIYLFIFQGAILRFLVKMYIMLLNAWNGITHELPRLPGWTALLTKNKK